MVMFFLYLQLTVTELEHENVQPGFKLPLMICSNPPTPTLIPAYLLGF